MACGELRPDRRPSVGRAIVVFDCDLRPWRGESRAFGCSVCKIGTLQSGRIDAQAVCRAVAPFVAVRGRRHRSAAPRGGGRNSDRWTLRTNILIEERAF